MRTPNKSSTSIVRFIESAVELKAANGLRDATQAESTAFKTFYDAVIVPHAVPLTALKSLPAGERRSNEAQAAYDFTRRMFWIATFGVAIADLIKDANVKGDAVLPLSSVIGRNGMAYQDQAKRAVAQSFGGARGWGLFVARLIEIEGAGGQDAKRDAAAKKSDKDFVTDRIGAAVKRLAKDAEKMDGSIAVDVAPKLAKALLDVCASFGIK